MLVIKIAVERIEILRSCLYYLVSNSILWLATEALLI